MKTHHIALIALFFLICCPQAAVSQDTLVTRGETPKYFQCENTGEIVVGLDGSDGYEHALLDTGVVDYICDLGLCGMEIYLRGLLDGVSCSMSVGTIEEVRRIGDINADADLNIFDVVVLINYILGEPPGPVNSIVADINNDGLLDVADAILLINIILEGG